MGGVPVGGGFGLTPNFSGGRNPDLMGGPGGVVARKP